MHRNPLGGMTDRHGDREPPTEVAGHGQQRGRALQL